VTQYTATEIQSAFRSGNQPSAYIAVYIGCEDLTAKILAKRSLVKNYSRNKH